VVVEPDLGDGSGVEAKLGIEGDAHGGGLEDFRFRNPRSGIPRREIRALAEIFERNS